MSVSWIESNEDNEDKALCDVYLRHFVCYLVRCDLFHICYYFGLSVVVVVAIATCIIIAAPAAANATVVYRL